jgi:Transposase IS116/IS110/IS902 family
MTITITAFERSPDGGKGLARDTRVRWALEEVGQPYEVRLVSFRATTALVASVPDPNAFRSGRNFSAWIGLVPKQHSSGSPLMGVQLGAPD